MNITDLIKHLNAVLIEHGDIDLALDDADTGWIFKLEPQNFDVEEDNGKKRLTIAVSYSDKSF